MPSNVLSKGISVFSIIFDLPMSQYLNKKIFWYITQFAKEPNSEVKWLYPEVENVRTNIFLILDFLL